MASTPDEQTQALLERLGPSHPAFSGPGEPRLADFRAPHGPAVVGSPPVRPMLDVADLLVPAPVDVPVRVFVPETPAPRPAVIWLHPGGFVAGAVDDVEPVCRTLAADARCAVISVEYRLAPEHPYPAALDDVTTVARWLGEHGATLGVDPARLAIGGQSAGANLAAATVLRLRDEGAEPPIFQVLAYPVLDPRLDAASHAENAEGYFFTTRSLDWCWRQYLGDRHTSPPATAAPLYAESLHGLPPALILAAAFDPARDDSRRFHGRLVDAGVEATLREYETIHAFLNFADELDVAADALAEIAGALRSRLASSEPRLQHVALTYRRGEQAGVRRFYGDLLGLDEKPVPAAFRGREFIWFAAGPGECEIHLIPGDTDGRSDAERHAALALDRLEERLMRLERAGHATARYDAVPNRPQAFLHDPFGNLIELTTSPGDGGRQG